MTAMDMKLIKMITNHYWLKCENVVSKIDFKGRIFYNKFKYIDSMLTQSVINRHLNGEITVAHSLIKDNDIVENIVIDYNGMDTQRFYHRAQLVLREEGYLNFTAFASKTKGHLHLYIHKGHTTLQEAVQLGKMISMKLAAKQPKQWKVFPTNDMPREYNILTLPYDVYAKERASSWSKHM